MSSRDCHTKRSPDAVELLLQRAYRTALSGSLIAGLAGCATGHAGTGGSPSPVGPPAAEPTDQAQAPSLAPLGPPVSCAEGVSFPARAAGLVPAESYDYVAIRQRSGGMPNEAPAQEAWDVPLEQVRVVSDTGKACGTASDPDCATKVARHPSTFVATSCVQICGELSVVTTRGNEVRRWAGPDELRTLLGTIDSVDDALLLAAAAGYDVVCNDAVRTSVAEAEDGYVVSGTKITSACAPVTTTRYRLHVSRHGEIRELAAEVLERNEHVCIGRKPEGLRSAAIARGASKLGDFLSQGAHLEAASVESFARLARELEAHGAPRELVRRALEARDDEVRHAEVVSALARARGGELSRADVDGVSVRSLEAIAIENAVEGCVRETYGALVGAHQAEHAHDGALRRAMVRIADDEARHASLSHAVHAWIMTALDDAGRERVRRARARAILELALEAEVPPDTELAHAAGLPSPSVATRLIRELMRTLWRDPTAHAA